MHTLTLHLPVFIRVPSWEGRVFIFKIVLGLLVLVVAALLGLYLFQTGDLLAKSFALRGYESAIEELSEDTTGLHIAAVGHASLEELEQKASQLNFVRADQIRYIPLYPKQLVSNTK